MSTKPRLVILNSTCLEVVEQHREYLDAQGVDWVADASFHDLQPEDVDKVIADADALILPAALRDVPLSEQMTRHQRLKVLSIAASGFEWLDVSAATECGIVVTHAPVREGFEVVADLTFGLLLAVMRQIPYYDRRIRAGDYQRGMCVTAWRKALGIVGLGGVGKAVARRAAGFNMRVLATEPQPDLDFVRQHGIELLPLDELLRQSDVVSLHVRLNDETAGMIGARELGLMKPSAFLVNAARTQLVDDQALTEAVFGGRLAGAALDDPPARPDHPLLGLPNVVYSPHAGNRAIEGVHAVFRCAIDNAVQVLRGYRPKMLLNPEVYSRAMRAPRASTRFQLEIPLPAATAEDKSTPVKH